MDYAVLHVARRPFTGVWSVIRNLAAWQSSDGLAVGVGVLATPEWSRRHAAELESLRAGGWQDGPGPRPVAFSIAYPLYVLQWPLTGNPIARWAEELARETGRSKCVIHCHNAWLSGAYVPVRMSHTISGLIATYHGIQGAPQLRRQPVRRRVHGWLARRFVRHGGILASVDRANTAVAHELFGLDPQLFTVVPNGVRDGSAPTPTGSGSRASLSSDMSESLMKARGGRSPAARLNSCAPAGFPCGLWSPVAARTRRLRAPGVKPGRSLHSSSAPCPTPPTG